jgi:hypothetical protein
MKLNQIIFLLSFVLSSAACQQAIPVLPTETPSSTRTPAPLTPTRALTSTTTATLTPIYHPSSTATQTLAPALTPGPTGTPIPRPYPDLNPSTIISADLFVLPGNNNFHDFILFHTRDCDPFPALKDLPGFACELGQTLGRHGLLSSSNFTRSNSGGYSTSQIWLVSPDGQRVARLYPGTPFAMYFPANASQKIRFAGPRFFDDNVIQNRLYR